MARFQIEGGIYMHANTFTICQKYFLDYTVPDIPLNLKVSLGKKKKNQVYNIKDNSTAEIVACVL